MSVTVPNATGAARALSSIIVGAFAGALMVSLCYAVGVAQLNGVHYFAQHGRAPAVTVFLFAFVFWFLGLVVFAVPLWRLLRRMGARHWFAAATLGAILTFTVTFCLSTGGFGLLQRQPDAVFSIAGPGGPIIFDETRSAQAWPAAFRGSLFLGIEGALIGLVVWRAAYRRKRRDKTA